MFDVGWGRYPPEEGASREARVDTHEASAESRYWNRIVGSMIQCRQLGGRFGNAWPSRLGTVNVVCW